MNAHRIVFKFEGGEADQNRLDPSDFIEHVTAARQLLALHAHFFTTTRIAGRGVHSRREGYKVSITAQRAGSLEVHWIVETAAREVVGYVTGKLVEYTYEKFLKDSITGILSGKPSGVPPELRREPVFEPLDRGNTPFVDVDAELNADWQAFRGRSTLGLTSTARPVGRCASRMSIYAVANDNFQIGIVDEDVLRRLQSDALAYRQMQITEALKVIRPRHYI